MCSTYLATRLSLFRSDITVTPTIATSMFSNTVLSQSCISYNVEPYYLFTSYLYESRDCILYIVVIFLFSCELSLFFKCIRYTKCPVYFVTVFVRRIIRDILSTKTSY